MLDSLDTLIAFTVIITVVSLLITISVQMLSAWFNLRGKNLAQGLVETFLTVGGNKAQAAVQITKTEAQKLSGYLLTRTGLSDHALQGSSSISDPQARKTYAESTNPLGGISGGWFNRALSGAVRPDEIFSAIQELARLPQTDPNNNNSATPDAALIKVAEKLATGVGIDPAILVRASQQKAALSQISSQLLAAVTAAAANVDPNAQAALDARITSLKDKVDIMTKLVTDEVAKAAQMIEASYERFKFWFESGQDRAQQWFTSNTRWFTMVLALIFAFAFQLDTVEIYGDLSRNPEKAKAIAAQASVLTDKGEKILTDNYEYYSEAIKSWIAQQKTDDAKAKLQPAAALKFEPLDTRGSATKKVLDALGGKEPEGIEGTFGTALDGVVQLRLKDKRQEYTELRTALDKTGFEIIPSGDGWRWGENWRHGFGAHFLGMLFSAALLSLGAPFWFNILKSLTNLRSALAQELDPQNPNKPKSEIDPATGRLKAPPSPVP